MINQKVVDILLDPKNAGMIKGANAVGKATSEVCSDIVRFYLMVEEGVVVDAKFKTFGGATLIAVASITTSLLVGRTIEEVLHFDTAEILRELGPLPSKKGYSLNLISQALDDAVSDYFKRLEKEQKSGE